MNNTTVKKPISADEVKVKKRDLDRESVESAEEHNQKISKRKTEKAELQEEEKESKNYFGVSSLESMYAKRPPEVVMTESNFKLPFPKKGMTILAAKTNHGKTAFLVNVASEFIKQEKRVLFVTLEEEDNQILYKLMNCLCYETLKDSRKNTMSFLTENILRSDEATPTPIIESKKQIDELYANNFYISQPMTKQQRTAEGVVESIKKIFESKGYFDFVMIDYIQKIKADKAKGTRQIEIQDISDRVQTAAKELDTSITLGAQLGRGIESPDDMSIENIREANDIAQDADLVYLLWNYGHAEDNKSLHKKEIKRNGDVTYESTPYTKKIDEGVVEIKCSKFRNSSGWIGKSIVCSQQGSFVYKECVIESGDKNPNKSNDEPTRF